MGPYEPDVLFTTQSNHGHYLPQGMHFEHIIKSDIVWDKYDAPYDFTAIKSPVGRARSELASHIESNGLPGEYFNDFIGGEHISPDQISGRISADGEGVHQWKEWRVYPEYMALLLASFSVIYPGVEKGQFWDSKHPWQALGAGCMLLAQEPSIDTSEYPWPELAMTYRGLEELQETCDHVMEYRDVYDGLRIEATKRARKYMCPSAMASYFLQCILDDMPERPDF